MERLTDLELFFKTSAELADDHAGLLTARHKSLTALKKHPSLLDKLRDTHPVDLEPGFLLGCRLARGI